MKYQLSFDNWPKLVPILIIFAGMGGVVLALVPNLTGSGDQVSWGNRQLSLVLSGLTIMLTGLGLISAAGWRYIGQWFLVGAGVVTAIFAADLLVIYGLPGFRTKQIMLASIGFGLVLSNVAPVSAASWRYFDEWLNLFTINKVKIAKFFSLVIQLGLLVLLIRQFQLENQAFYHHIVLLTFYGFLIHSLLPFQYRLYFFLFLSLGAIVGILGFPNGLWLIGLGLGLIAICHLPVPFPVRVAALLVTGIALAVTRSEWIEVPWSTAVWPILGSMFMFRLIVYMYDLKHRKEPANLPSTLSYFFLLPNVVFPLFPLVDYSTFRRTYYDDDHFRIYQKGIQWMAMGAIHLIVYRFANYYLVMAPEDVTNASDLVRYIVTNFMLLLRVSGRYHLIIGILHLFGFNLPRAMREYFLASSFTDVWRRANIYWKDFMLKVFYYPTYFRLRKHGPTTRLILSTILVFFVTWSLHSYQWYWLRGSFLLTWPDFTFWAIFGFCVLINALVEVKSSKKRSLSRGSWSFRETATLSLRTLGIFTAVAILYSLWTSPSILEWFSLLSVVMAPIDNLASLIPYLMGIGVLVAAVFWRSRETVKSQEEELTSPAFFRTAVINGGLILSILMLGTPEVYNRLGSKTQEVISDLRVSRLSDRDAKLLLRGYYENLMGVNQFNTELWEIYTKRPADWPLIQDTDAARLTSDFLGIELVPSKRITFHGAQLTINRWGMRDRDYSLIPQSRTYRISLLGPSFVMGSGVADHEVFEWLLEERLNQENDGSAYAQYEILNFGIPGTSAIQELVMLEEKVIPFEPDALFFVAHHLEEENMVRNLANRMRIGVKMPYSYLDEIASRAGINENMTQVEAERRLKAYGPELLSWTYNRFVEISRERDILPVWIFIPALEESEAVDPTALIRLAEETGFLALDLSNVYENEDKSSLIVAEWDRHPNSKGHRLIADRLYEALREKKELIP